MGICIFIYSLPDPKSSESVKRNIEVCIASKTLSEDFYGRESASEEPIDFVPYIL